MILSPTPFESINIHFIFSRYFVLLLSEKIISIQAVFNKNGKLILKHSQSAINDMFYNFYYKNQPHLKKSEKNYVDFNYGMDLIHFHCHNCNVIVCQKVQ